ncbi:MAG: hypothetical protein RQ801_01615 [Spirochaetaceae bacterium]|nr:hypothetical protein [Spirochaetaceae bacterium]
MKFLKKVGRRVGSGIHNLLFTLSTTRIEFIGGRFFVSRFITEPSLFWWEFGRKRRMKKNWYKLTGRREMPPMM